MKKLKGRLQYLGWFHRPWKIITDEGETDLWPIMDSFLSSLAGERASHRRGTEDYALFADPNSGYRLTYEPDKLVLLETADESGMLNVHAYLDEVLVWLSGRMVEIEIDETEKSFKAAADPAEQVFGVYFTGDGNSCGIPDGAERTVCKMGEGKETCIFLSFGSGGFYCEKFSGSTARLLLDRLAEGTIKAGRIGNCAVLGREEEPATATGS